MYDFMVDGLAFHTSVGDLALVSADAIVCAANSFGHMRGGVSQALRLRGGDVIEEEARRLAPIHLGTAVATTAGSLPAQWVIHAPTIRDPVEVTSARRIKQAAHAAVSLAGNIGARSIAFPALGTGVGEVTFEKAAIALVDGILEAPRGSVQLVKLVARVEAMQGAFVFALERASVAFSGAETEPIHEGELRSQAANEDGSPSAVG